VISVGEVKIYGTLLEVYGDVISLQESQPLAFCLKISLIKNKTMTFF